MNIIRLSDGQKRQLKIDHPLLNGAKKMSDDDILDAMNRFVAGDDAARDDLIMGQMYIIKVLVGRYLAHWPETRRFQDDMISEAMVAVIEVVDALKSDNPTDNFQGTVWNTIKSKIERMLTKCRSMFTSSHRSNHRRLEKGLEPDYNYAQSLHEDVEAGRDDDGIGWVDMLDELELLGDQDKEHFRALILRCMEQEHNLEESDLTPKEMEALNNLAKMVCEL